MMYMILKNTKKNSRQEIIGLHVSCEYSLVHMILQESIAKDNHKRLEDKDYVPGYTRTDHQFCTFKNYNLTYSHFTRPIIQGMGAGGYGCGCQCILTSRPPLSLFKAICFSNIHFYLTLNAIIYIVFLWISHHTAAKFRLRFSFFSMKPR